LTNRIRHAQQNHGFTLLEVMVAVAIIAIGLTALLGSHSQSVSLASEAKFNTTATLLAQDKMAQLELEKFQDVANDSGDFGEEFPHYRWELQVSGIDLPGYQEISKNIRQIDLTLLWGDSGQYRYTLKLFHYAPSE
jgi:general secretion pathway protein I